MIRNMIILLSEVVTQIASPYVFYYQTKKNKK